MRSAPPVQVPVGRFAWIARVTIVLAICTAGFFAGAWQASTRSAVPAWGWLLIWVAVAWLSHRLLARESLPPGELLWDGDGWSFLDQHGVAVPVGVEVLCDMGRAMLVQVRGESGGWRRSHFAWIAEKQMPGLWHDWRCAVHSHDIL